MFRNGGIGREYNLEMGGGIGREAVLGGAVLGGRTVPAASVCFASRQGFLTDEP